MLLFGFGLFVCFFRLFRWHDKDDRKGQSILTQACRALHLSPGSENVNLYMNFETGTTAKAQDTTAVAGCYY